MPMMETVECRICHTKLEFVQFLSQFPMPAEEVGPPRVKESRDRSEIFRLAWVQSHPASAFQCLDCRSSVVPC
jgi:hypothetical protein